ncbi:MAG: PKD domain-containing protein [Bacteroidia bacterium]
MRIKTYLFILFSLFAITTKAQLVEWQNYHDVDANLSYISSTVGVDGSLYTAIRYNDSYDFNGNAIELINPISVSEVLISKYDHIGNPQWSRRIAVTGGPNPNVGAIEFMAVDASGYIYLSTQGFGISGFIRVENDSIPFIGSGNRIIQLYPSGNIRSTKQLNTSNIYNIACGGEFVYVAGYSGSNSVIQKYDSTFTTPIYSLSGNTSVFLGASAFQRTQMASSPSGEFIALLAVEGGGQPVFAGDTIPMGTSSGFDELFVLLCDSSGTYLGNRTFLANDSLVSTAANPHAVAVDDDGVIYISTFVSGTRIFNGDTLVPPSPNSNTRAIVAAWNAEGEELWASQFYKSNSGGNTYLEGLNVAEDGSLLFTGFAGGTVFFNELEISTSSTERSFSGKINSNTGELIWVLEPEVIQNNMVSHRITAIDNHRYLVSGRGFQDYRFTCMETVSPNQSKTQFFIIIDENLGNPIDADFLFTANADVINFTSLATGADSWSWDFGDGSSSSDENPVHTYAEEGVYEVNLIASNCQYADTISLSVPVIFTGINSIKDTEFKIFPNPVNDILNIRGLGECSIFDSQGRVVLQFENDSQTKDVSQLKQGIYFLKGQKMVARFVKL